MSRFLERYFNVIARLVVLWMGAALAVGGYLAIRRGQITYENFYRQPVVPPFVIVVGLLGIVGSLVPSRFYRRLLREESEGKARRTWR